MVGVIAICISVSITDFSSKASVVLTHLEVYALNPAWALQYCDATIDSINQSFEALKQTQVSGLNDDLCEEVHTIMANALASSKSIHSEKDVEKRKKKLKEHRGELGKLIAPLKCRNLTSMFSLLCWYCVLSCPRSFLYIQCLQPHSFFFFDSYSSSPHSPYPLPTITTTIPLCKKTTRPHTDMVYYRSRSF